MKTIKFDGPRNEYHACPGWSRWVVLEDGRRLYVGVRGVKRVRVPYRRRSDPRGVYGWRYEGFVMEGGRYLFCETVPGSLGARGLLEAAGVFECKTCGAELGASHGWCEPCGRCVTVPGVATHCDQCGEPL